MNIELQQHMIEVSQAPRVRLHVIEAGPENPRRTIVFVHGYGGWSEHWLHQMSCFKESARVIAFDLRGHSHSDKPKGASYSLDNFTGDLERLFEQLNVKKPVTLVGHSIGAALVSHYALRHPGKVESLVLINPSINYQGPFFTPLLFLIPDSIFDFVLNIINKIRYAYAAPSYVLKSFYQNGLIQWDAQSVLPQLKLPTLILTSSNDPVLSQHDMRAVHNMIEDSIFKTLQTRSHMTMIRRAEAVNAEMADFIELQSCS